MNGKGVPKDVLFIIFSLMDRRSRVIAGRVNSVFYALSRHSSWNWRQQAQSWIPWKTPFVLDLLYSVQRAWKTNRLCMVHSKTHFSDHLWQLRYLKNVACFRSAYTPYGRYAIDYHDTRELNTIIRNTIRYIFVVYDPRSMTQTNRVFFRIVFPFLFCTQNAECVCCLFYEPEAMASQTMMTMKDALLITERLEAPTHM